MNLFNPRPYQQPLIDAFNSGYKRILAIWPRRAGKDVVSFNLMVRRALTQVGVYYYIFPTYSQGKKVIYDAINNDGQPFLDYIPASLIRSKNSQEMKITLINSSIIQIVGSDNIDSLVGTNPKGCIFSEFALQDPRSYQFLRPILVANGGWSLFISTPRGTNHLWDLYNTALKNPEWYVSKLTVEDTKHISLDDIKKEEEEGLMSADLIQQEYFTSFSRGVEGAFYSHLINKMKQEGKIGNVPWDPTHKVHTVWDLGLDSHNVVLFAQVKNGAVYIIEAHDKQKGGLIDYIKYVNSRDYSYGRHFAPHDIDTRDIGSGVARMDIARQHGISFSVVPKLPIQDGIEAVRCMLPKTYIDQTMCKDLIRALENYHREYDAARNKYNDRPYKDWSEHFCFIGKTLIKTTRGDVPIDSVIVGDEVYTPTGIKKVAETHQRMSDEPLIKICVGFTEIVCTPGHEIFTNRGLVRADSLRYNDIMEPYSNFRRNIWKMISGYNSEKYATKGFKKTILSAKMKNQLSLMDILIDGLEDITDQQKVQKRTLIHSIEQFGSIIMDPFQINMPYTTLIMTDATIQLRTYNSLLNLTTCDTTRSILNPGLNQRAVRKFLKKLDHWLPNGIEVKKVCYGIKNMPKTFCQPLGVLNMIKIATIAKMILSLIQISKGIVQMLARRLHVSRAELISKKEVVRYVLKIMNVESMLEKKHAVISVQYLKQKKPVPLYDLTVEDDNCYYANGYLVSNSDCTRYLAIVERNLRSGMTAEDVEEMRLHALNKGNGYQGKLHNNHPQQKQMPYSW